MSVPDFGIDEIGFLLAFRLLATVYRNDFAAIRAELRGLDEAEQPDRGEQ